jgi:TolB-like protein/DNA-binding winged helix-turn-helix (wHTH) protein/Tfp pilus assembly protein PilF
MAASAAEAMSPTSPAPLAFDSFAIDFAGRRLLRGGVEQALEPKAFAVLALLAEAPGKVFTRDEILDAVWGHRHVTPGVLNRIMTLLRHALGEDAQGARYLHTVHGVGYRFDLPASISPPSTSEPETESPPPPPLRAGNRQRAFPRIALWSLPLLAVIAFAGWTWWLRKTPTAAGTQASPVMERSIAVLPLVNTSNDKGQQFFSDGLSESLINALSRFGGLKVIGRDSAFQFRDGKDDSRAIGRKLGVSYLLSGSVQHVGDLVRINAALTRTADGSTLWAEHYDRPYKDLFALQDEIASAVIGALKVKLLSPGETAKHDDRPPSGNLEAYSAYLQGLKFWHDEDFPEAAEHLAKAVQLDPGYAVAWADLSGSLSTVATFPENWDVTPATAREHMRRARFATDRALQLAPGLGAAHAAHAYLQFYSFDYRDALAECRRAVQLAPDTGMVLNGCGFTLAGLGKLDEALRLRERLLSIEPLYPVNAYEYAKLLRATGRLDEAEKYLRIAEGLSGPDLHGRLIAALARGDAEAAMSLALHMRTLNHAPYTALAAQMGPDRAAADRALAVLLQDKAFAESHAYRVAQVYALRGDADHALEWLQRAPANSLLFLLADPILLNVRDDPRFIAFCEMNGLPPPGESEALSIDQIRAKLAAER